MEQVSVELLFHFDPKPKKEYILRSRWFTYLVACIYAIYVLLFLEPLMLHGDMSPVDIGVQVFCITMTVLMFCLPYLQYWTYMRRIRKLYPNGVPDVKAQFGDSIIYSSGNDRVEYKYEWIQKTKKYRYSYVLITKGKQGLLLPYDSYTKGDFETLKALLREKCPNAKIKD